MENPIIFEEESQNKEHLRLKRYSLKNQIKPSRISPGVQGCKIRNVKKPGVIEELQNTKEKETKGSSGQREVRIAYKL